MKPLISKVLLILTVVENCMWICFNCPAVYFKFVGYTIMDLNLYFCLYSVNRLMPPPWSKSPVSRQNMFRPRKKLSVWEQSSCTFSMWNIKIPADSFFVNYRTVNHYCIKLATFSIERKISLWKTFKMKSLCALWFWSWLVSLEVDCHNSYEDLTDVSRTNITAHI